MKPYIMQTVAAVVIFLLGAGAAYYLQALKIDALEVKLQTAQSELRHEKDSLAICQKGVSEQNKAIDLLRELALQAESEMQKLQTERDDAEERAQQVLRNRPAPSENVCEHARNEFAAELARERGL